MEFNTIIASVNSKSNFGFFHIRLRLNPNSLAIPFIRPSLDAFAGFLNTSSIRFLYSTFGSSGILGQHNNNPNSSKKFHT